MLEASYTAGENVEKCGCFGKIWQFSEKLNIELSQYSAFLFQGIYQREMNTHIHVKTCTLMLIAAKCL